VIVAAFDAEEPPHFMTSSMGSEHFARHPTIDLKKIDMMACMDLVGHALGGEGLPSDVRDTVFALGAERSEGTGAIVRGLERAEPGVVVRRVDAEVIPPSSDYAAFWHRRRPFLLLTNARSRVYHTPEDVPELLAYGKMAATARWLERFVRASCTREDGPTVFRERPNDLSTVESLIELTEALAPFSKEAELGLQMAKALRAKVQKDGTLTHGQRSELAMLVAALENGLA
jgi:hypothetical protein